MNIDTTEQVKLFNEVAKEKNLEKALQLSDYDKSRIIQTLMIELAKHPSEIKEAYHTETLPSRISVHTALTVSKKSVNLVYQIDKLLKNYNISKFNGKSNAGIVRIVKPTVRFLYSHIFDELKAKSKRKAKEERNKTIIELYFRNQNNITEIANELDIDRKTVRSVIKQYEENEMRKAITPPPLDIGIEAEAPKTEIKSEPKTRTVKLDNWRVRHIKSVIEQIVKSKNTITPEIKEQIKKLVEELRESEMNNKLPYLDKLATFKRIDAELKAIHDALKKMV